MILLILLAGCAQGPPRPVDIEPADVCASCKMAISEARYAAELIDSEDRVFKFDDIGCMLRFARERNMIGSAPSRVHIFVHNYGGRDWLEAGKAHYVKSPEIPSPMASGLVAFADAAEAQTNADRFHGLVIEFAELWHR